jgi:hypothetical protein
MQRPAWLIFVAALTERDAALAADVSDLLGSLARLREQLGPLLHTEVAFAIEGLHLRAEAVAALAATVREVDERVRALEPLHAREVNRGV